MLLLIELAFSEVAQPTAVHVVFGVGLIGSSLRRQLLRRRPCREILLPFTWESPRLQSAQLDEIQTHIARLLSPQGLANSGDAHCPCVNFVWTAGKCGFSSTEAETRAEFESFARVVSFGHDISEEAPNLRARFFLISSAGGVFEGSRSAADPLQANPIRPYGILKLQQEALLRNLPPTIAKRVFRLSSVYGYIAAYARKGLVQSLLLNGICRRVTEINGNPGTLRDFVFCEDVGAVLADSLLHNEHEGDCEHLLASGKPSTIAEVQKHIETVLQRKLYLQYCLTPDNVNDIYFPRSALPPQWAPTDLATGIRTVYHEWRRTGSHFF